MQKAILHNTTLVVRRLTIEANPVLRPDEIVQDVPDDFDLAGGPWKLLANGSKVVPTQAERDEGLTTPARSEIVQLMAALNTARQDVANTPSARAVFTRMLALYRDRDPVG